LEGNKAAILSPFSYHNLAGNGTFAPMFKLLKAYKTVDPIILKVIGAQAALQFVNAAFVLVLPLYMENTGYEDHEAAGILKYRFIIVLLLAFPFGLYLKGRKLMPFFYTSAIFLPLLSFLIVAAVEEHQTTYLYVLKAFWGLCFMLFHVSMLPFILRNTSKEKQSESISLSYATWSFATVFGGLIVFGLQTINPVIFTEKVVLYVLCSVSALSIFFLLSLKQKEVVPPIKKSMNLKEFDWPVILQALVPNILIAIGAGMTIPFISLFFSNIFDVTSSGFSLIAMGATVLVFFTILLVPSVKKKWGYGKAIPITQGIGILMLAMLATTEYYSTLAIALPLAILFYVFRQPFMNMAAPMSSEFTIDYVGKRNEEIMSALNAAIWSGSWFFSGWFFQIMRNAEVAYSSIFFITVVLYVFAVLSYIVLIRTYNKRTVKNTLS